MESTTHSGAVHAVHYGTPSLNIKTYVFLMVMMFLTIAVSRVQLGPLNNIAAMTIALAKATAVVLFFMQVKYSTKLTWVWASLGFLWLSLMFGILGDYVTRTVLAAAGWDKIVH
jgi:cytochrome c oxidase subunit IV